VNGVASPALAGTHVKPQFTITGPGGRRYLLWKVFLNVAPSAAPYRTVSVKRPTSARLYYADPRTWSEASDAAHVADAKRRVRLPACGSNWSGYTGGIVVPKATCVTLSVSAPDTGRSKSIAVPVAARC
jgi:hypothetical protein